MKHLLTLILGLLLLAGCHSTKRVNPQETIYVTIPPLKSLVQQIVGPNYPVEVLLPAGASPESFELTARQMADLSQSPLIFTIGLIDFAQNLLREFEQKGSVVNLGRRIKPIVGSCSHDHPQGQLSGCHGIEPQIGTSPKELQRMASQIFTSVMELHPDSLHYKRNNLTTRTRLLTLDRIVSERIQQSGVRSFLIYHPAFSYYARAYGLEQIAVEHEGKEPSARRVGELIRRAKEEGHRRIFYQSQFPASTVEVIASDLGAEPTPIDPLAEDIVSEILRFTDLLCETPLQE